MKQLSKRRIIEFMGTLPGRCSSCGHNTRMLFSIPIGSFISSTCCYFSPLDSASLHFHPLNALMKPTPCRESPDRAMKSGARVRSYGEFIEYLMEKHPGIRKADLGFVGQNQVLYWDPLWETP